MSTERIKIEDPRIFEGNLTKYLTLFQQILNQNLKKEDMLTYFFSKTPEYIDSSLIKEGNETIGFINAAFYKYSVNGKTFYIARGAAGVLEKHRKSRLPSMKLCAKYMLFKLRHPFSKIYIDGHMANPILYTMMCKYAWKVYPKLTIKEPQEIAEIRKFLNPNPEQAAKRLVDLEFEVRISPKDRERIEKSRSKHMLFFRSINPAYGEKIGVQTIIPLTFTNILFSLAVGISSYIKK